MAAVFPTLGANKISEVNVVTPDVVIVSGVVVGIVSFEDEDKDKDDFASIAVRLKEEEEAEIDFPSAAFTNGNACSPTLGISSNRSLVENDARKRSSCPAVNCEKLVASIFSVCNPLNF